MRKYFLERFIEKEQYQQNSLLTVNDFIDYCKKRCIVTNERELEFFEKEGLLYPLIRIDRPIGEEEWIRFSNKDGNEYIRPARYGLNEGEKEIGKEIKRYYSSYNFDNNSKELFLEWIKEGILFDPSTKPFQEWSLFKGDRLLHEDNKIISLYISYQIYWLEMIKKSYSINIDLSNGKLKISSPVIGGYNKSISNGSFELNSLEEFVGKFKKMCEDDVFKDFFDIETKKLKIKKELYEFNCILEFLISVQSIYAPYGRSSAKSIQLISNAFDQDTWEEKRRKFDPKKELEVLNLDIKMIFYYYQLFSMKTSYLLGEGRAHDWIQLWKSIRWYKKDLLEGSLRLGVEYLQWALIHKRFIEDYLGREILDVDEIIRTDINFALECDPYKITRGMNLRGSRNERLSDDIKNYYTDIYKRLFYLVNDLWR